MKPTKIFSSKRSALGLWVALWIVTLFSGISYAQNLTIPTNGLANNRITIKQIFLSPTGSASTIAEGATIVVDGMNGTIQSSTVTTNNLTVNENATVHGELDVKKDLKASSNVFIISQGAECRKIKVKDLAAQETQEGSIRDDDKANCILYIDQDGQVKVTTDLSERITKDKTAVFQRNPNNEKDSYFATKTGVPSTVSKNNFLRVGATSTDGNPEAAKEDAAMVVAGSIESRGGMFIKKSNNTEKSNEGVNLRANLWNRDYTSLDTTVNNGNIYFEWAKKVGPDSQDTNFLFSAKGATAKLWINTISPQANLHLPTGTAMFGTNAHRYTCGTDASPAMCTTLDKLTMFIDTDNQKVGIKTSSPQAELHIAKGGRFQIGNTGRGSQCTQNPDGTWNCGNNNPFFVADSVSEKVSITNNTLDATALEVVEGNSVFKGFVGIATDSPQYSLDVDGTTNISNSLYVQGNGGTRNNTLTQANDNGIASDVMDPNDPRLGNIDIIQPCGIAWCDGGGIIESPFFEADGATHVVNIRKNSTSRNQNVLNVYGDTTLQGTVKATSYLTVGHPIDFVPTTTDKLFVNGSVRANAYYYNSDARYKANIAVLTSPLEKLLSLHGYSYYNKLSEKNDVGVIAQEVEKVFPELVQTDTQGYKTVAYANLVAPLIEAVKELAGKVDVLTVSVNNLFDKYISQQLQIKTQQSQIDALNARLQALEAK